MMNNHLKVDRLLSVLAYNAATGEFRWLVNKPPRARAGRVAGYMMPAGYRSISLDGRSYYAHRLAWFYIHGEWPTAEIDHVNGDKSDNRAVNLRAAARHENGWNTRRHKNNTSGFKGVHFADGKWLARIRDGVRRHILGSFSTPEEAHAAYCAAAARLHGEFARTS